MFTPTEEKLPELKLAITAVAEWWADKMQRPMNWNNGDDSQSGGLMFMMANKLSMIAQESITQENIKVFKQRLCDSVLSNFISGNYYKASSLSVDYGPDTILFEAAEKAGINSQCFPCKSSTRINDSLVCTGRYQYGGKEEIIFNHSIGAPNPERSVATDDK